MRERFLSTVAIVGLLTFVATLFIYGSAIAGPKKSEYLYFVGSTPHFTLVVITSQKGYFMEYVG